MTPFVSENDLNTNSAVGDTEEERVNLPTADWHHIHDAALDLHRSPSIPVAVERLAVFTEQFSLGKSVRAVLSDESGEGQLLYPPSLEQAEANKINGYHVTFDVKLPDSGCLRILIDLPANKSIHDQVKLELLLEHFHVAAQHLPISF